MGPKESLSFSFQGLLLSTLECLTEELIIFSLGGKTHLHLGLVDAIPGVIDTFQTWDNLALHNTTCEIPVVQASSLM